MPATTPTTRFDDRFSDPQAGPLPWDEVRDRIAAAGTFWITTVRADGRPHVTPLFAVWDDGALHFCTGPMEQKARNLEASRLVALTTGTSATDEGVDIVVEGTAEPVHDDERLRRLSDLWAGKYGEDWRFDVRDGDFAHEHGGVANVYAVEPRRVLAFGKAPYSHTSFRFGG